MKNESAHANRIGRATILAALGLASFLGGSAMTACGSDDTNVTATGHDGGGSTETDGGVSGDGAMVTSDGSTSSCGSCPTGYTCGTFNGSSVCASPAGIPLFDHVTLVMMENLSYATLTTAIDKDAGATANLRLLRDTYASGDDYHGAHSAGKAVHPSLPNYIALTSGDYQNITCDCKPLPEAGACSAISCNLGAGNCGCNQSAANVADQIEAASKTWKAYGEGMGTPCNIADNGGYAVRHVPFLYYDTIRENSARCTSHVVDYSAFATDLSGTAPNFMYVAPNLTDDGHDPNNPANHDPNIANADIFLGKTVPLLTASNTYKNGGLVVIVWDEDDSSGVFSNDAAIPIFVLSPYAKKAFVSHVTADHASLLATIEDGLNLPRLGQAKTATPLADYFK